MLVLSRKPSEDIVFPALGITIRVLRTSANTVKLGVHAPLHLQVLRGELTSCDDLIEAVGCLGQHVETHDLRNRLNSLILKLELIKRSESKGLSMDQLPMVEDVANALASLDSDLGRMAMPTTNAPDHDRKLQLLVVDDDANERELLSAVLTLQGFDIQVAEDGAQAMDKLNKSRTLPDAILLDIDMPKMGGEHTLRCIRSDRRFQNLNVIGISGHRPRIDLLPDSQHGFDAWFSKPLRLQQLLELINQPPRLPSKAAVAKAR